MFGDEYGLILRFSLAPPLAGKNEQFAEGARNDTWIGSRGPSSPSRQVMNAHFPVGIASAFHFVEQFGIDHRSPRFKRVLMQDVLSNKLCMNTVWPPLDHTLSSFKQGLAGQMLFPLPQALERHSDGLSLHECATFARVAALDEKDIGRRWRFSHAHFAVYAPHQARVNRRSACYVESAGKRIP